MTHRFHSFSDTLSTETDTKMLKMFVLLLLRTIFIFSVLSLRKGECGTKSEIYMFYDGKGEYHPGIVNYEENLSWFFGNGPQDSREKDIHFLLYSRGSNQSEELTIGDTNRLKRSKFNKTLPTKFIIHGFTNSDKIGFPPSARKTFLENNDSPQVNLIIVDWGKLAQAPWYNAAARNTFLVGVKVARFIEFLVEEGTFLDKIHLIGHSLGAHVAGFAGSNLENLTLSRITALDPALPLFGDTSDVNRVDPSDALYVDVIHTAGGESSRRTKAIAKGVLSDSTRALAFIDPRGHADFYVNGGRQQPGCGMDFFGTCSHIRAYEYYLESVLNPKGFLSCECENWEEYKDGICDCPTLAYLGDQCSSSAKGSFFLRTRSKSPYALSGNQSL